MNQPSYRVIHWRRLFVESAAVILSILLAFAIDAWWDAYQQRGRERDLLEGLLADFEASRPGLESRMQLAERIAVGTGLLLDALQAGPLGSVVSVPDTLILAAISGPTYEADTNTLDAALASGEIEIVTSDEIRSELSTWRRGLTDNREDELEVRRLTNEQLVPELAREIHLGPYFGDLIVWSGGDPYAAGRLIAERRGPTSVGGGATLRATTELAGVLATRKFYVDFSAANLSELLGSLDRLVELIRTELRR